jgi:lactaldehyde dehydrogenase / glycolaldehyde dehydrogenase
VAAVQALKVGDPMRRHTQIGPKVSGQELDKTLGILSASVQAGATLLTGGERLSGGAYGDGHWMSPGVVVDVSDDMGLMRREVFGPVTPISRFSDWSDVAARSNDSIYGLSAYVYTNDLGAAIRASRDLAFGEVYVTGSARRRSTASTPASGRAGWPATTARTGWRATSSSRPCTSDTELVGRVDDGTGA